MRFSPKFRYQDERQNIHDLHQEEMKQPIASATDSTDISQDNIIKANTDNEELK
jgi:hypothetical protein